MYNNSIYTLNDEPDSKYRAWAHPKDIMEFFKIDGSAQIPQVNSSWIKWRRGEMSDKVFETAQEVLLSKFNAETWRGVFPDELAFNIAMCMTKTLPHKKVFRPVYFHFLNEYRAKEYIIDNYIAFSIIGTVHDDHVISIYNDFVAYYSVLGGVRVPLNYSKSPITILTQKTMLPHKKVVLARIGGFGSVSEGGVINPSAWKDGSNYQILFRSDANLEGYRGRKNKARCRPILATYDKNFNFISAKLLIVSESDLMEDFRVINDNNESKTGCCSAYVDGVWNQWLFFLTDKKLTVYSKYNSDKDEKNWAWFRHNGKYHFIYSVEPYVVMLADMKTVVHNEFDSGWDDKGFISCSTFPVKYGMNYLVWVHKKQKNLTYRNSAMIIDGNTLLPKYFIPYHVLGSEGIEQPLYISSCVVEDDRILIFGGEGGVPEMNNAALKSATVRIIDRETFDNIIKQYPCTKVN